MQDATDHDGSPGAARWLATRLAPALAIALTVALLAGLWRGAVLFLPGILGMAAGAAAGYGCGRLERRDGARGWGFGQRLWLTAGAATFYAAVTAAVVSVLHGDAMHAPLDWLSDVLAGHESEPFFGVSSNSLQSVGGRLRGAWWLVFGAVDAGLFGFLFLVFHGIGLGPIGPDSDAPSVRGLVGGAAFVALALAGLAALGARGPLGAGPQDPGASARLQGVWVFDEGAAFLGATEAERTFTLSLSLRDELFGAPADPTRFVLTLSPRPGGLYQGRLNVRGTDVLPARMRASADGSELELVVDWFGPGGRSKRTLRARRAPDGR